MRHLGLAAFAPATEGAAAKLGRVLPDSLRDSANSVDEVVSVEAGPWVVSTLAEPLIRLRLIMSSSYRHSSVCRTIDQ